MIPEPHRKYVLELLIRLGSAADSFVLAGAQAMKYMMPSARSTRDFDFVLDVVSLRQLDISIAHALSSLGYSAVPEARNFQFQKPIPESRETMRIEFIGPQEYRRTGDFRVDVEKGVHARACSGVSIAIAESDVHPIQGRLPSGERAEACVRVTRPNALVFMKLLALDDRYRNLRGRQHAEHDRNEARIHAGDIVAVLAAQTHLHEFRWRFAEQFRAASSLRERAFEIIRTYFDGEDRPGILLYEELLRMQSEPEEEDRIRAELQRARRMLSVLLVC